MLDRPFDDAAAVTAAARLAALPDPEPELAPSAGDGELAGGADQAASFEEMVPILKLVILGLTIKAAERWGAHWMATEAEADSIARPAVKVIAKHWPQAMAIAGPEGELTVAVALFVIGRVSTPKAKKPSNDGPVVDVVGTKVSP